MHNDQGSDTDQSEQHMKVKRPKSYVVSKQTVPKLDTKSEPSKVSRKKHSNKCHRRRIIVESSEEEKGEPQSSGETRKKAIRGSSEEKEEEGPELELKHTGGTKPVSTPTHVSARLANRGIWEIPPSPSSNSSSWQEQDYHVDISGLTITGSNRNVGSVSPQDKIASGSRGSSVFSEFSPLLGLYANVND